MGRRERRERGTVHLGRLCMDVSPEGVDGPGWEGWDMVVLREMIESASWSAGS